MKRVIVTVTNDLTTDQRVSKVCDSLEKFGYDVFLIGRKLKSSKPLQRSYQTKRFSLLCNKGFLFYAEYNIRLFFFLLFTKKDILVSNDLDTLLPNYLVSELQSKVIVYDSHELFTEVPELQDRPFVKKCWLKLERLLLTKIKYSYTVSESIANYYYKKYKIEFKVIKNYPVLKKIQKGQFPFPINDEKIVLYQGVLNKGRGIELMIDTIKITENCLLVLIGAGDLEAQLKEKVKEMKLQKKVFFLGRIAPLELHKLTPLAAIGLSLEEDLGLNYRYALPNKIFDYLHGDIPVIVSDLTEMKHHVTSHKVGEILSKRTPAQLAKQINEVFDNNYVNAIKIGKEKNQWSTEEVKLAALFKSLI